MERIGASHIPLTIDTCTFVDDTLVVAILPVVAPRDLAHNLDCKQVRRHDPQQASSDHSTNVAHMAQQKHPVVVIDNMSVVVAVAVVVVQHVEQMQLCLVWLDEALEQQLHVA